MAAGKNKVHRKKRISKHVLESQKRRDDDQQIAPGPDDNSGATTDDPIAPSSKDGTTSATNAAIKSLSSDKISSPTTALSGKDPAPKKKKKKKRTRDPSLGHAYLSSWKHRSSGEGVWKFNKNTQSWLIKNMYDCDKIPKGTFSLLIDYIGGLKGEAMRKRVDEDAVKRALRYKNWEKSQVKDDEGNLKSENVNEDPKTGESAKENASPKEENVEEKEEESDETRWEDLSSHDKRNEYKRARKVIDAMKVGIET